MAGIQTKRYGLGRQLSHWEQLQARRERSKALREQAETASADVSSALQTVGIDQVSAAGELAAKRALKRIADAADAKLVQARAEASRKEIDIWKNKAPATSVSEGGTTVDLNSDTITLSNGTAINIKTGKPAGNLLTLADGSQIDLDTGHKVINIVT